MLEVALIENKKRGASRINSGWRPKELLSWGKDNRSYDLTETDPDKIK